jgi:diaminopimelate epimerase
MRLDRYHGLGNDYLVLAEGPSLTPALVRAVCDRHRGVGGDGVLEPMPGGEADVGVRIWNPDGSVAEKSGNGLRIFAQWCVDVGRTGAAMSVWTGTDLVRCWVEPTQVVVEMGRASFEPADVPTLAAGPLIDGWLPGDPGWSVVAVGLGNPHCVLFSEGEIEALPWRAWGEILEVHPWFPHRTNVQFARVLGPATIELRIWERGAGVTEASGSSACAVAAAAVRTGRVSAGRLRLLMPGGELGVEVREDWSVRLEGPVERVGGVEVDGRWLGRRVGATDVD